MSYRDSPHYQEACRRLALKKKCRTDLGRLWNHQQFIAELKAMLDDDHRMPNLPREGLRVGATRLTANPEPSSVEEQRELSNLGPRDSRRDGSDSRDFITRHMAPVTDRGAVA